MILNQAGNRFWRNIKPIWSIGELEKMKLLILSCIAAVTRGKIMGIQGSSRRIYEIDFNKQIHYISIEVSSNGYIVGANPTAD
jgi:hypothetical protein